MLEKFRAMPKTAREFTVAAVVAGVAYYGVIKPGWEALNDSVTARMSGNYQYGDFDPVPLRSFATTSEYAGTADCEPTAVVPRDGEVTVTTATNGQQDFLTVKDNKDGTMNLARGDQTLLTRDMPTSTILVGTQVNNVCVLFERNTGVEGAMRKVQKIFS